MNFLVIEGNIGAGKTTLARKIGNRYNAGIILEQFSDNPFLPGFYKDPGRYTFPLELSFLAGRYNQIENELLNPDLFKSFTVSDYYFSKSLIFSSVTLSGHEYKLYRQLYNIMIPSIPRPDLYVYLHRDADNLLLNIKKRGRPYEQEITPGYLKKIEQSYFDYMKQQDNIRFLLIDAGKSDFASCEEDFEKIAGLIFGRVYPAGLNRVIL